VIDCADVVARLRALVDSELPEEDQPALQQHLAECGDCAALVNTYRLTVELAAWREDPPPVPQDLRERLRSVITAALQPEAEEAPVGEAATEGTADRGAREAAVSEETKGAREGAPAEKTPEEPPSSDGAGNDPTSGTGNRDRPGPGSSTGA
jgi:anti-sigma factor RsiW